MSPKQRDNYNRMFLTLRRISQVYQTSDKIKQDPWDGDEALKSAYDQIKAEATLAIKGVREV